VKPLQLFQDLKNSTQTQQGRLLGLDVGEKYVGLALSDFDNKIASPFRYHVFALLLKYNLLLFPNTKHLQSVMPQRSSQEEVKYQFNGF